MRTKQQAIEYLMTKQGATKEEYNGLTIVRYDMNSAIFHKSFKPLSHYRHKSEEGREEHITQQKKSHDITQSQRSRFLDDRLKEWEPVKEGSILYYSWGYDQTNIDFYKVVKRSGPMVEIVEIEQGRERTEHDGGRCWPLDKPVGEPFKKKIGKYGITMSCGSLSPWDRETIGFTDGR